MCIRPTKVYPSSQAMFKPLEVPCRKCWACLKNKTNILVGKTLMEYSQSDWAFALTLTYDDKIIKEKHPLGLQASQWIHKKDFQNFMSFVRKEHQRLNKDGNQLSYRCSYLVAGEYGSRKGRSHFHVILMGDGIPPRITKLRTPKQYMPSWPWGFVFSDIVASDRTVHYVAKYLVKELRDQERKKDNPVTRCWVSYSKYPPLGAIGFEAMGRAQARAQIMPQNLNYIPPLETRGDKYSMTYSQERIFWKAFIEDFPQAETLPCTQWVHNSRLRFIKHRQKERWEALDLEERQEIILEDILDKLRHSSQTYVQPDYDDDGDSFKWRADLTEIIEFVFSDQKIQRRALRKLYAWSDKATPQRLACLINLPRTRLLRNLSSERDAGEIHLP